MTAARAPAYEWIRKNLPPDAQLLNYDDPLLYLYTGRRGLAMPIVHWVIYGVNAKRLGAYFATAPEFMREHGLDYVLMTESDFHRDLKTDGRTTFRVALNQERWFEPLLHLPGAQVYRLKADALLTSVPPGARAPAGTWWASVRQSTPSIR
jgi:hypothetical protein